MNIKQGIEIAQAAKKAGYAVAVRNGKVQFQTVEYSANGTAEVTPKTEWLDYDEAMEVIVG